MYGEYSGSEYISIDAYADKVYLLLNDATSQLGALSKDLSIIIIDQRTGFQLSSKVFGSTGDDLGIYLVANHLGLFVLATIDDGFKDTSTSDTFSTQNSRSNFAILMLDHLADILEIESYDLSVITLGASAPQRLVVGRRNKHAPLFGFISTRDNKDSNQGGGIYITQPSNQLALFATHTTLATCTGTN